MHPDRLWAHSLELDTLRYWIENEPTCSRQAVFLDTRMIEDADFEPSAEAFSGIADSQVKIIAAPL